MLRQLCRRSRFKDDAQRQVHFVTLSKTSQYLGSQQRVSAKFEKIVMDADGFDAEKLLPCVDDENLNFIFRRRKIIQGFRPADAHSWPCAEQRALSEF